ncbi:MAG TPA: YIP1 family protein [candidate division Zixibacteria bacterium]|nr:YIP1 family protein [candidate division Zixibacteria bacterium]
MEENIQSMPESTQDNGVSIWSIIIGVFTSPTKAFAAFARNPKILAPLIVILVLAGVAGVLTARYNAQLQYDMMKTSTIMPPAALEEMHKAIENTGILKTVLGAFFGILLVTVLEALVAWFLGSFVFGGESKFKSVWGVGLLAGIIPQIGNLLRVPLVYAKGTMLVSYGLAAALPGKDFSSVLYSLLYYLDVFAIWGIIAAGFGYTAIFNISKGKGMTMAWILGLLFLFVMVGIMIVGYSFAGINYSFL